MRKSPARDSYRALSSTALSIGETRQCTAEPYFPPYATECVAIAYRLLFAYPFVRPESEQNSSHLQIDCAGSLAIVTLCSVTASFMTCYLRKTTEAPAISTGGGTPPQTEKVHRTRRGARRGAPSLRRPSIHGPARDTRRRGEPARDSCNLWPARFRRGRRPC
jgi:hypothetical protein